MISFRLLSPVANMSEHGNDREISPLAFIIGLPWLFTKGPAQTRIKFHGVFRLLSPSKCDGKNIPPSRHDECEIAPYRTHLSQR